jgi:heterodisulfide reductase subunit C
MSRIEIDALLGCYARNFNLRNLIHREPHKLVARNLLEAGHFVKIDDKICRLREKLGLSKLPPTTLTYKKALEDIRLIMRKTGFDKLISK